MIINKYSKNVLISTLPGFLAILLSFFSIPIFLQNLGLDKYGNYLILHIILSITHGMIVFGCKSKNGRGTEILGFMAI